MSARFSPRLVPVTRVTMFVNSAMAGVSPVTN